MRQIAKVVAVSALAAPSLALAHPFHEHGAHAESASLAVGSAQSVLVAFGQGLAHPWTGADHLLALVAVALWSLQLGERFPKLLSSAFLGAMSLGLVFGAGAGSIATVESLITLSLVVFGAAVVAGNIAAGVQARVSVAVVAAFASMHGVAHGVEFVSAAPVLPYLLGSIVGAGMVLLMTYRLASHLRLRPLRHSAVDSSWALRSMGAAIILSSLLF